MQTLFSSEKLIETWLLLSCGFDYREPPGFHSQSSGNRGLWWCIKLDPNCTKLDWLRHSNQNQTRRTYMRGDCPSSPLRMLSEQWHHCSVVCVWHYQMCGEGKEQRSWTEMERRMHRQRQQQLQRNTGNKRVKASSCVLAELTVNRGRFIFSGACCSLKEGIFTCLSPGLLWSWARGAEDGISGLKAEVGSRAVQIFCYCT